MAGKSPGNDPTMSNEPNTTPEDEETQELDDGFEPVSIEDAEPHEAEEFHAGEPSMVDGDDLVEASDAPPPPSAPQKKAVFSLPAMDAVTMLDREFIQRVFVQVRDVDFRSPPPPPPKRDLAGPDKKIALLRQKIHELERDLARVGFVWGALQQQYESIDKIVASKEAERLAATERHTMMRDQATRAASAHKAESDALNQRVNDLSESKAVLEIELGKTKAVAQRDAQEAAQKLAKSEQEKAALMQDFRGKMEMAQNAFTQLRDQSMRAVADLEGRLAARDKEYTDKQVELEGSQAEVLALKGRVADFEQQVSERDTKLTTASEDKARLVERLAERDRTFSTLTDEMARTRTQHDEYVQELRASVKSREDLLDAARTEVSSARDEFKQLGEAHAARATELSQRGSELEAARTELNALKAQADKLEQDLTEREGELTEAKASSEAAREEARLAREDAQRLGAQLAEAQAEGTSASDPASQPAEGSEGSGGADMKSSKGEGKDV